MRDAVIRLLADHPEITATEISRKLNASRTTVIKYLKELRKEGLISFKEVGPARLWYLLPSENGKRAQDIATAKEKARHLSQEIDAFLSSALRLSLLEDEDLKKLKAAEKILRRENKS